MIKQSKIRASDLNLEPWAHEDDIIHIQSGHVIDHEHIQSKTLDFEDKKNDKRSADSLGKGNKKYYYVEASKKGIVKDFIKKNLEDVKMNQIIPSNYASILLDERDLFIPINPRSTVSSLGRRPSIKTTCIGYYDQNPLHFQSPLKNRKNQALRMKSASANFKNRTRTSDSFLQNAKLNPERKSSLKMERKEDIFDCSALKNQRGAGVHHLQKVLKIKEKLRQKLKNKSQMKDKQRNQYLQIVSQDNKKAVSSTQNQQETSRQANQERNGPIHVQKKKSFENRFNRTSKSMRKTGQKSFFAIIGGSFSTYEI